MFLLYQKQVSGEKFRQSNSAETETFVHIYKYIYCNAIQAYVHNTYGYGIRKPLRSSSKQVYWEVHLRFCLWKFILDADRLEQQTQAVRTAVGDKAVPNGFMMLVICHVQSAHSHILVWCGSHFGRQPRCFHELTKTTAEWNRIISFQDSFDLLNRKWLHFPSDNVQPKNSFFRLFLKSWRFCKFCENFQQICVLSEVWNIFYFWLYSRNGCNPSLEISFFKILTRCC